MNLSQTRVCQIVSRVAEFLLANTPGADDQEQQRKQLRLAEQIAAERIDHLRRQAVEGYERSLATVEKDKPKAGGGDPRYLYLAARLTMLGARLPTPCLKIMSYSLAGAEAADEAEECPANPPAGACSVAPPIPGSPAVATAAVSVAKTLPPESSIAGVGIDLIQKLAHNGTVQTASMRPAARGRDTKRERRAAFLAGS
jgi:hypothetical protein